MRKTKVLLTIIICVLLSALLLGCELPVFSDFRGEEGYIDEETYVHAGVAYKKCNDHFEVIEVDPTYTSIEIVPEIDGTPVTTIANIYTQLYWLYLHGDSFGMLCSIIIPPTIKEISEDAFVECVKLVEVCNLSSLNIEVGSKDNGYIGYYAKDIYTTRNYVSKIQKDDNGFILYEDGTDVILLGYKGEEKDIVIPDDVTEIRGAIASGINSIEITIDIIKDLAEVDLYEKHYELGEQPYEYSIYEALLEGLLVKNDVLVTTIYSDYLYKEYKDIDDTQLFTLYLDTLGTVKTYYLFGETMCNLGFLYIDSSLDIPDEYLAYTVLFDQDADGEKEVHRIEYVVYDTKEYNGKTYNRMVYKLDGELQQLPEEELQETQELGQTIE